MLRFKKYFYLLFIGTKTFKKQKRHYLNILLDFQKSVNKYFINCCFNLPITYLSYFKYKLEIDIIFNVDY